MCIELVMPSSHLILTHVIHYYIQVPTGSVVSDSVRSHRWQPTRLPHPWDSPGKNTGVACHFLLQCVKVKSEREVAQLCLTPSEPMLLISYFLPLWSEKILGIISVFLNFLLLLLLSRFSHVRLCVTP